MLLTLCTRSFQRQITGRGADSLSLLDLPELAVKHLGLRGLNVQAGMLAGWSVQDLDALRDRADKAACPCLVLVEDRPLSFGDARAATRVEARDRVERLAVAAHRLGCNALGLRIAAPDTDDAFDAIAEELKSIMPTVERFELNLLLAPEQGLTDDPDRLTELIKRIGGFRIGALPDFAHAATHGDAPETLRKLAPYAGAIHATIGNGEPAAAVGASAGAGADEAASTKAGTKKKSGSRKTPRQSAGNDAGGPIDLAECVRAIRSVGFVNTLAVDYIGEGDPREAIEQAREILQAAIDEDS